MVQLTDIPIFATFREMSVNFKMSVKGHTVSELRPNFTSLTFPLSIKRLFYVGKGLKMRPMTLRPLLGCR